MGSSCPLPSGCFLWPLRGHHLDPYNFVRTRVLSQKAQAAQKVPAEVPCPTLGERVSSVALSRSASKLQARPVQALVPVLVFDPRCLVTTSVASCPRPSPRHLTESHAGRQGRRRRPAALSLSLSPKLVTVSLCAVCSAMDAGPSLQTTWQTASFFRDQSSTAPSRSPGPSGEAPRTSPLSRPVPAVCGALSPPAPLQRSAFITEREGAFTCDGVRVRLAEETVQ